MKVVEVFLKLLTKLGYAVALKKSQLTPTTSLRYLGFIVDPVGQAYLLPPDKKQSFVFLRDSILNMPLVDIRTLQCFTGKCISFSLVVPAAKLYFREVNYAIPFCMKNSRSALVNGPLREEIEHWKFIDTWTGRVPWRSEMHTRVSIATDASSFRYGVAVLSGISNGLQFGDFWDAGDVRPIHLKEADAILRAIGSLGKSAGNNSFDVLTDNMAVVHSWNNHGGRDP